MMTQMKDGIGRALTVRGWGEPAALGAVTMHEHLPEHPWPHMFTATLPAFRKMGMTPGQERIMMQANPQRIVPVQ